jgi:hypothetical protein
VTVTGCSFTLKIHCMAYAPYTNLQATPDFAAFQFASPTLPEPTIRQVRFNGQQGGRIYHVEFRSQHSKPDSVDKKDDPSWRDSKDFYCVVLTTVQIIEIYSERYPRRILWFSGDTALKALVFGTILVRFHHLLAPLFQIETETPGLKGSSDGKERSGPFAGPDGRNGSYAYLMKRKPFPYVTVHTIESTWNGTSRIFNNRFSIELDKSIRIGLTLPPI